MQEPAPGTYHYIVQWHVDLIVEWGTVVGNLMYRYFFLVYYLTGIHWWIAASMATLCVLEPTDFVT